MATGWRAERSAGVRSLLRQAFRWQIKPRWYAAALWIPAAARLGAFLLWRGLSRPALPLAPRTTWLSLPLLVAALLVTCLFEEVGWRVVLPRLQRHIGALRASVVVGIVTWLYNRTGGSLLIVSLFHSAINAYPAPWGWTLQALPPEAGGSIIQFPIALALAGAALVIAPKVAKINTGSRSAFSS